MMGGGVDGAAAAARADTRSYAALSVVFQDTGISCAQRQRWRCQQWASSAPQLSIYNYHHVAVTYAAFVICMPPAASESYYR